MYGFEYYRPDILRTESGGDYNALFGYQNRPGGRFQNVRVTDMTIGDILEFQNPRGAYGQYVAGARPDRERGVATPVGAYQIVGTTLRDAVRALNLPMDTTFTPDVQDRIAKYIFETQGPQAWQGLNINETAGQNVARATMAALGRGDAMNGQPTTPGLLAQSQQPQQQPFFQRPRTQDVLDQFIIGLEGMSLRPNVGLVQMAQERIGQRREEQQTQRERNATAEWLRSQGRDDLADGVLSGAVTGAQALAIIQRQVTGPEIPANFRALQLQAAEAGLQPGTPEYQQFMLYGGAARDTTPAAFAALDAQAKAAGFEPGTPEYQNFMRTQGAGDVAAARAAGAASGEAAINLTGARVTADRTLALIDLVKNDPALPDMVGPIQGRLPNISADAQRFASRLSQLQGTAFLEAYNMLRGGGQITEVEGQKAEQAIVRLNQAQSEQDFLQALREFEDAVRSGIQKLEAQAGAAGGTAAVSAPATPSAPAENDPLGLR